jgi:hypothetical protein
MPRHNDEIEDEARRIIATLHPQVGWICDGCGGAVGMEIEPDTCGKCGGQAWQPLREKKGHVPETQDGAATPREASDEMSDDSRTCDLCGKRFASFQGVQVHKARMHRDSEAATQPAQPTQPIEPSRRTDIQAVFDMLDLSDEVIHFRWDDQNGTVVLRRDTGLGVLIEDNGDLTRVVLCTDDGDQGGEH